MPHTRSAKKNLRTTDWTRAGSNDSLPIARLPERSAACGQRPAVSVIAISSS
jgi:hypothetical protein